MFTDRLGNNIRGCTRIKLSNAMNEVILIVEIQSDLESEFFFKYNRIICSLKA